MIAPILTNAAANTAMAQLNNAAASQTLAAQTNAAPVDPSALSRLEAGGTTPGTGAARTSGRSWGQRALGVAGGILLGALTMYGCTFDSSGATGTGGSDSGTSGDAGTGAVDGSSSSDSGTGGTGGDGGGGALPTGPSLQRPTPNQILPAARAFLLWQDGEIPADRTVAGYLLCTTADPANNIEAEEQCPNETSVTPNYSALNDLTPGASVRWKVRARFDDDSLSRYSAVGTFQTDDSLAAWLKLDEGSGSTAEDSGALGNAGTLINAPTWGAGFLGQALTFAPTSYVSVANDVSLNFPGDFSLSAWVRSNATGQHQAILYKGAYSLYKQNTGKLSFYTPGCGIAVSAGDVTPSVWHHVMARRVAGTVSLFLDGQLTGSAACAENLTNANDFAIGCVPGTPACAEAFDGAIDDVIVTMGSTADPINELCSGQALSGVSPLDLSCLP